MTDQEIKQFIDFWAERGVDKLPDPKHYPIQFQWWVKVYKYLNKDTKLVPVDDSVDSSAKGD